MGAGSSSCKRTAAATEPEPEPEQDLPQQTAVLSAAALAVAATSAAWEDGSSPASFSSSAMSAVARQPPKAIGQYARRRGPTSAVEVGMRGRRWYGREDVASDVIAAAVTIQSAFRAHRVRQQIRDFRQVAEAYSTKIGTSRGGDRRTRRGRDRVLEKHSLRDSPLKSVSPASIAGKRSALQPLQPVPMHTVIGPQPAAEIPEDLRSARVREWVATGGEISPGGDITINNRSAVADAFLSGSQAKPAKLSTAPVKEDAVGSRDTEGQDYHATSVAQEEGSQVGADSVSSYDGGVSSSFRRRASRPGPPSVTTQSSWDDGAFANIPSPSDVRKRARARKGPRRKRHPPRQRGSESATSRSDASTWQPSWQGLPAGWPGPGWGYVPPPSASYGPPATAPAGVLQSGGQSWSAHPTVGWADAFYQGDGPPMVADFPPAGTNWSQHPPPPLPPVPLALSQDSHQQQHHHQQHQHQQQQQQQQHHQQHHHHHHQRPPPPQQPHYGHPGGPASWWGAPPHEVEQFQADVAAAHAGTRHAQMSAQQSSMAASDDMLGRIGRIEGAMEALLQRLTTHPMPLEEKLPPLAKAQNHENRGS